MALFGVITQKASPMDEKHSALGIASFVMSVAIACLMFMVFIAAGILHNTHPDGPYPGQTAIGFLVITLTFVDLAAIGLGIASLCQKTHKRIFGAFGLAISSLTVAGSLALVVFGLILTILRR